MAEAKKAKEEDKKALPIIKKIKKVSGGGHHGGAWKIAYADFVTAMMAFFLLLWLLSTTPSKTLQGIADYFAPTVGLKDQMGIGVYGGKVPLDEGSNESESSSKPTIIYGTPNSGPAIKEPTIQKADEGDKALEEQVFKKVKDEINRTMESNPELKDLKKNISVTNTPEGLRIDIFDVDQVSMFKVGSSELEPNAKELLKNIEKVIQNLPNHISVAGHTDSRPYSGNNYSNWELSADRANASRRFLVESGLNEEKITRVVGNAEKEPLVPAEPESPLNRRISITLLYKSVAHYDQKPAPDDFLNNPAINSGPLLNPKPAPGNVPEPEKPGQKPAPVPEKPIDPLLNFPGR